MKITHWTAALAAMALMVGCASQQAGDGFDPADEQPVTGENVTLTVHGMSCPLCANNIDKQLLRVEGVKDVVVDLQFGVVSIDVDPTNPPTRRQLKQAIINSGFTLKDIQ